MSSTLDLDRLIDDPKTKVVVCCGSGGVGKTTTSAALAVRAAERGRTTVVLTIDPARRLAQSLGLDELDNFPKQVSVEGFQPSGQLWAMMLDMRRTFDDMIIAHSDPARAQELLNSPFYQTLATSFSGTQEYMAMEKLGHLVAEDEWDLIIVDTPPSRNALDFLDAPNRLSTALDGRMVKLLTRPSKGFGFRKALTAGIAMGMKAVSQVIGGQLLTDASAFMQAFNSTAGGFKERAAKTAELMRSPGTAYIVVAAPEPDALREASYFVERLSDEHMPLAGLVANRTHPVLAELSANKSLHAADSLEAQNGTEVAAAVLRLHADRVALATREQRLLQRFTRAHPGVPYVGVPALPSDVHDLEGLRIIGERLSGNGSS